MADPITTFIFTFLCFLTTLPILRDCITQLMEGAPSNLDMQALKKALNEIENIKEIHDLHVWTVAGSKMLVTIHLVAEKHPFETQREVIDILRKKFGILHATVQVELERGEDHEDKDCCDSNIHC